MEWEEIREGGRKNDQDAPYTHMKSENNNKSKRKDYKAKKKSIMSGENATSPTKADIRNSSRIFISNPRSQGEKMKGHVYFNPRN